jgi:hypothetical protein
MIKQQVRKRALSATVVLDFIHVLEYLWKAAFCFDDPGSEAAEEWVQQRAYQVLEGKASTVAAGMRRSAILRNLSADARKPIDTCAGYLLKYADYLKYDEYLQQGFPIATGVIEGACRHLIADRMDITGARWRLARAEAILKIRALRTIGDFDEYWIFHKTRELKRNYLSRMQDPELLLAA